MRFCQVNATRFARVSQIRTIALTIAYGHLYKYLEMVSNLKPFPVDLETARPARLSRQTRVLDSQFMLQRQKFATTNSAYSRFTP